jgi:hypothetical protein
MKTRVLFSLAVVVALLVPTFSVAAEADVVTLSEGNIKLTVPKGWVVKKSRVRIIEREFSVPAVEGDTNDGRVTMMGAGGSIEANVNRWIGQFQQPDGSSTKKKTTIKKLSIDGQTVHFIDIPGTYRDQRGPFAPPTIRKDYRMLAIIIPTEKHGQYFVKFYGPKKTVAANEAGFDKLVKSIQVAK